MTAWSSPSIYLDNIFATDATKNKPPFWLDMITAATDGGAVPLTNKHFPDWVDDATAPRDATYSIPSISAWGTGEMGSPRDPDLITPGDIHCDGQGLTIGASTADKVVWHSDIWNTSAGVNSDGIFDFGGQLMMLDASKRPADNKMAVKVLNTGATPVDRGAVKAHFLIAPYGSQAPQSIWSPLTVLGNDYTCAPGSPAGSCTPQPQGLTGLFDSSPTTTGALSQNDAVEIDMSSPWRPSANYVCAVQKNDTPNYSWYYEGNDGPGALCQTAVWKPNSKSGAVADATGLPGHQCMQAQLFSTTAGVQFATRSAFRNMHQASASMHREVATIDTRGLKKIKNKKFHDIYLYVETQNMPFRVDAGYAPPTYNETMKVYNKFNHCGDGEFAKVSNEQWRGLREYRPLAFSADGKFLVAGDADCNVRVWNVATGKTAALFKGHGGPILSVAFFAGGRRLISGSADSTALIWDISHLVKEGDL